MKKKIDQTTRTLFIDVETTGLDPNKHDIIEIAGAIYVDDVFKREFCYNAQPLNWDNIEKEALEVNGITLSQMKKFPKADRTIHEIDKILINYYGGKENRFILAAHNLPFDKNFLENWLLKSGCYGLSMYFCSYREIDTLPYVKYAKAKGYLKSKRNSLGAVCKELGIEIPNKHRALDDVRACAKMYYAIERLMGNTSEVGSQQLSLFQ